MTNSYPLKMSSINIHINQTIKNLKQTYRLLVMISSSNVKLFNYVIDI